MDFIYTKCVRDLQYFKYNLLMTLDFESLLVSLLYSHMKSMYDVYNEVRSGMTN